MKAIRKVRREPGLVIEDINIPPLQPDEILVKVEAASVCGTDLHIWKWDEWSQKRIKTPLTLGHEFAGTIVEIGSMVRSVAAGDYISAESHVTCGICFQCRIGTPHLCPETQILGVDRPGVFSEYAVIPEKIAWKNDRSLLPPKIATLQEPFGNAVFTVFEHEISSESVAILGCGPIGLFSVGIARAMGASAIYAVDISESRLALARRMGATAVFNPSGDDPTAATAKWLIDTNGGFGIDVVLEMSGAPSAIAAAFESVRTGGRVTLFGIPSKPITLDVAQKMIFKNLTILALNGRRIFETWYKTRWLLENKIVDLEPLVTHVIQMEQINDVMPAMARGEACKIVIDIAGGIADGR